MSTKQTSPRLLVIGAGVVGFSTAVRLQASIPMCHVTVMADKFSPETTSDGAAGIFRPTKDKTPGVPMDILRTWLQDSWNYLCSLATSGEASSAGVTFISGCHLFDKAPSEVPLLAEFVHGFREMSQKELDSYPGDHTFGWAWKTVICESRRYLPYLTRKFLSQGGTIQSRKLQSLTDIEDSYDVIINCAGFGNRSLTKDAELVPVRGHLLRVEAPWVKNFHYHSIDEGHYVCYIVPGRDYVMVGGTKESGNDDLQTHKKDGEIIWKNACFHMPALKGAKIIEEWVGLRPHRKPLRLEKDAVTMKSGKLQKIVHNYGHGAEGVPAGMDELVKHSVRSVPATIYYIPNFITSDEEKTLLDHVYNAPKPKWTQLRNRRLQNWGGLPHPKGMVPEKIPQWLNVYCQKIGEMGAFEGKIPNHVLVNEYLPGQGIMPHLDGPLYYPTVSTITLGSHALLNFYHPLNEQKENESSQGEASAGDTEQCTSDYKSRFLCSILLEPRSLVLVRDEMYNTYLHGIDEVTEDTFTESVANLDMTDAKLNELVKRDTRVSLTIRVVPKVLKAKLLLGHK